MKNFKKKKKKNMHNNFVPDILEANRNRFAKTRKFQITVHVTFTKSREYEITILFSIFKANISFTKMYLYHK